MYYRRKIVLSLLQVFDNKLDKILLQKLLFLYSRYKPERKTYDFVPYKYGCYSFQANQDLLTLKKYGIVNSDDKNWKKENDHNYLNELNKQDKKIISDFKIIYGKKTNNDLIELTYKRYPYYAINSIITEKYLNSEELKNLNNYRSSENETVLFTIGYEGISLEKYLNKLIRNNVKLLCDVRKNALSMKYGFSKKQLENACNGVGIEYLHFPDVGIESDKRRKLNGQSDYDTLFEEYKKNKLATTKNTQLEILKLLEQKERIALTCFEANICQCHRKHLSESIANLETFKYKLEHI
ncbi:DUF488 domain-containing protein [uncultured Aquimarina sp.]|uniref:DUF488 domain-containing protein n=1 Tax=uncultured Aquimarina sp. TaxID=575652 RepID=UPI0026078B63|nr:DUF488 domain-containing protein [uncultured Aquimarina sp.]